MVDPFRSVARRERLAKPPRLSRPAAGGQGEPVLAGRSIPPVPIYRAVAKAEVAGLDALAGQVAVVHSPRAARRLAELIDPDQRSTVRVAVISTATAEAAGDG
jgi:hypothetical protein